MSAASLDSADESERRKAAFALAQAGDARAAWELFITTQHSTFAVEAVVALSRLLMKSAAAASVFDLQAVAHLHGASQEHYYDDSIGSGGTIEGYNDVDCSGARNLARAELARRGIALSPLEPLTKILESRAHDITFRVTAAYTLGDSRDPRALAPLLAALKKGSFLGAAAAKGLGLLGDPRAIPALTKAAEDSNKLVAQMAAESLQRLAKKA